jgi:hypothetical protein
MLALYASLGVFNDKFLDRLGSYRFGYEFHGTKVSRDHPILSVVLGADHDHWGILM